MTTQCIDLSAQTRVAAQSGSRSAVLTRQFAMTAMAASLAFALPAFADDAHHPQQAQETEAAPAGSADAEAAPTVQKMQDNLQKMKAQLDRIAAAKSDEERQKAMAEHMQTMRENMKMAGGMMGCPMMEGGMMGKGGMGMMGGDSTDSMAKHMEQMEKRMDMMQMMMEQMTKSPSMPTLAK
ncbi:MAG: hypothetical protein MUD07_02190 [Burkholderiaceae bacterium]|jgi:hypothetical protein|nr:hypothetical protein [Burkholderiaceae bacterium]